MWKTLVRVPSTVPNRDAKSYNRLILRCVAGWMVVALGGAVIAELGLSGTLIAIALALGLGNITARWIDYRHRPPQTAKDVDGDR